MGYKDQNKQREYQRQWRASRRKLYLDKLGPCAECGSSKDLEVDHTDPCTKVSHKIWSWSILRLEAELSKCRVLCRECHSDKSYMSGEGPYDHSPELVEEIKRLSKEEGLSTRVIGSKLGLSRSSVWYIVSDKSYKNT